MTGVARKNTVTTHLVEIVLDFDQASMKAFAKSHNLCRKTRRQYKFTHLNYHKFNFYFDDTSVYFNCRLLCFSSPHQVCANENPCAENCAKKGIDAPLELLPLSNPGSADEWEISNYVRQR